MKREPRYIILIFSLILGVIISLQIKNKMDLYVPATLSSIQQTKQEIDIINKEIEELEKVIVAKEEELESLENNRKDGKDIVDTMKEDIKKNQIMAGNTSLKGPGIVIAMYDNNEERGFDYEYDPNDDIIHDIDIFNIINDLRVAGAEAISINNQRVVSTSEIYCAGPTIRINKRSSGTPFIIKAIGDPQLLNASVSAPGTYGYSLKHGFNKGFDISIEDSLTIQGFDKIKNYRYATPKGEGE